MFLLLIVTVIIFFFLSGYWLWKLIKQLLLLWGETKHAIFHGHSCLFVMTHTLRLVFLPGPLTFWDGPQSVESVSLNKSTSYYKKSKENDRKKWLASSYYKKSRGIMSERDDLWDQYHHQNQGLPIILFCIFPVGFTPRLTPQGLWP